jgi:thiol-disulfide isomerase/thioredoxin
MCWLWVLVVLSRILFECGLILLNDVHSNCIIVWHGTTTFLLLVTWSRCGHCRSMAADWEQLANDWEGHEVGLIAEVDCTSDGGQPLCEEFEVQVRFHHLG